MEKHQILQEMLDLLENSDHWATGAFARTTGGDVTDPLKPDASQFDLHGCVLHVTRGRPGSYEIMRDLQQAAASMFNLSRTANILSVVNDRFGYDAVLQLLRSELEGCSRCAECRRYSTERICELCNQKALA